MSITVISLKDQGIGDGQFDQRVAQLIVVTVVMVGSVPTHITMSIVLMDHAASDHHLSVIVIIIAACAIGIMPVTVIIPDLLLGIEWLAGINQGQSCQ